MSARYGRAFLLASTLAVFAGACSYARIPTGNPSEDAGPQLDGGDGDGESDAGADAARPFADAASDADVDGPAADGGMPISVEPLYAAAPNWNDYVLAADPTKPCDRDATPRELGVCIHGGVLRKVELPGESSCSKLVLDDHGWFDWRCEVTGGSVVFRTLGLADGVRLVDLLDLTGATPKWKKASVSVHRGSRLIAQSEPAPLWSNPVIGLGKVTTSARQDLAKPGAIYVITATPVHDLRITADKVALVIENGVTFAAPQPSSNALLEAKKGSSARAFLWIDLGDIDTTGHAAGVDLDLAWSEVRNLRAMRPASESVAPDIQLAAEASVIDGLQTQESGIDLRGSHCTVHDVSTWQAPEGLRLGLSFSRVDTIKVEHGPVGAIAEDFQGTHVSNVLVHWIDNGDCLRVGGVKNSTFEDLFLYRCYGAGLAVGDSSTTSDASENDTFLGTKATWSWEGILLGGKNHRVLLSTLVSNGNGVHVVGDDGLVMHTTATVNQNYGVLSESTSALTLVNTVTAVQQHGVRLEVGSHGAHVRDLFATDNEVDLGVYGDDSVFSGIARVTDDNSCVVKSGLAAPGITAPPCTNAGASLASFVYPNNTIHDAVIGQLPNGDPANSSGQAPGGIVDPVGMDWYTFGNRWRTWFLAGATLGKGGARGTCMTGTDPPMCSVWDWRAKAGSLLGNKLGPSPYYALRDASNVITHDWQAISQAECDEIAGAAWSGNACTSTFLAHSYEPVSDGVGNDNGLCEPDEACIFNPNYGAYPGEGALVDSEPDPIGGVHIDQFGAITLKEFSINGE